MTENALSILIICLRTPTNRDLRQKEVYFQSVFLTWP